MARQFIEQSKNAMAWHDAKNALKDPEVLEAFKRELETGGEYGEILDANDLSPEARRHAEGQAELHREHVRAVLDKVEEALETGALGPKPALPNDL